MTKNVMTQKDRFQVQKLLDSVLEVHGEFVRYKDGWNDGRVAQECGCEAKIVRNTRARTFGNLFRQAPGPKLETRVIELEAQINELRVQMSAIFDAMRDDDLFQPEKSNGEFNNATQS